MANKKKPQKKSSSPISYNKVAFIIIITMAILYLVALILNYVGVNLQIVNILKSVASAIMVVLIAISAWFYVSHRTIVWKILYFVCLLVVIVGIILPLVLVI